MPRHSDDSSWCHAWFEFDGKAATRSSGSGRCRVIVDGERCKETRKLRNVDVLVSHLEKHGVNKDTPRPESGQRPLAHLIGLPPLETSAEWVVLLAQYGVAAQIFDNPLFRKLTGVEMNRKKVPEVLSSNSTKFCKAAMKLFTAHRATLAIDIGTRHRRYLALVVVANGKAFFIDLKSDEDMPDGRFTAANVRSVVDETIRKLAEEHNVRIGMIVADNASNMQAIMNPGIQQDAHQGLDPEGEELVSTVPFLGRCACHVLQLAVKDLDAIWRPSAMVAEEHLKAVQVSVRGNETRWNSQYRVISTCAARRDCPNRGQLEAALELLSPFAVCTDIMQSDSATCFDSLRVFDALLHWANSMLNRVEGDNAWARARRDEWQRAVEVITRRAEMMFSRPYLVLAFFAPCISIFQQEAKAVKDSVRTILVNHDPTIAEQFDAYCGRYIDPIDSDVTLEMYETRLAVIGHMGYSKLAMVLANLLHSVPSEASVERLFSAMRHGVSDWMPKCSTDVVKDRLLNVTGYAFFRNTILTVEDPEQQRRPPQPSAENLDAAAPDDDEEPEDAERPPNFEVQPHVSTAMLLQVLVNHSARPAPVVRPTGPLRTRAAEDRCIECQLPCARHEWKPYITCERCNGRRSVTHFVFLRDTPDFEQSKGDHKQMVFPYTCQSCLKK